MQSLELRTGEFLKNRALLPVVQDNICVDSECSNRRLPRKGLYRRIIENYARLAVFTLCAAMVGAIVSQMVFVAFAQSSRSAADQIHDAIERTRQDVDVSNRLSNLEFANKELRAENDQLHGNVGDLQKTQYIMEGIGIAFMASVGFIKLVQMVAGKKIKEDG